MGKINYKLFVSIVLLGLFGVVMIYSSSYIWASYKYDNPYRYVIYQSVFFIIGLFLMVITSKVNYNVYYEKANTILFICIVLLVLVLIPGLGTVRNGSRSWFGIGSLGIQPSEFTKLGLIIFTSKYLYKNGNDIKNFKSCVLPILLVLFLIFGLIMLQPDFGTGTIIVISIIGILFISGVDISLFIKSILLGIVGVIGLILVAPYRLQRILSFLNPWSDPLGSGFQIIQSLYAIGPGGLLGRGFGNSIQKHFYLPEPQTDFIFSIISEEFGFMGILIVATLFITIIYRGIKISLNAKDLFS